MKTNKNLLVFAAALLALSPLLYVYAIYESLPPEIPTHFGLNGPDKYSDRSDIWGISGLLAGVSLFVFILLLNINKIDPKKTAKLSESVFKKFAFLILFFITGLNFLLIQNMAHYSGGMEKYLPALLGVFFALLGNFMHSVKPNYFVGIRTPWTLENEMVWKKTHQLGGKLWFAGGIIITLAALVLPVPYGLFAMIGCVCLMAFIPVIYSYTEHRKLTHS